MGGGGGCSLVLSKLLYILYTVNNGTEKNADVPSSLSVSLEDDRSFTSFDQVFTVLYPPTCPEERARKETGKDEVQWGNTLCIKNRNSRWEAKIRLSKLPFATLLFYSYLFETIISFSGNARCAFQILPRWCILSPFMHAQGCNGQDLSLVIIHFTGQMHSSIFSCSCAGPSSTVTTWVRWRWLRRYCTRTTSC